MGEQYFGDLLNDIAGYQAQLAERDAEIAQLKAQVAELQAWKDAVPMFAIAQVAREPELASWDPIQEMRDWLVPLGYD